MKTTQLTTEDACYINKSNKNVPKTEETFHRNKTNSNRSNLRPGRTRTNHLAVRLAGFIARRMCCWLYPLILKTVVRKLSSCARESWSQRVFALCMREERTECLLAEW